MTSTKTCTEHNVRSCLTCFKEPGECDWGACQRRSTSIVTTVRNEKRPACAKHAKDIARGL